MTSRRDPESGLIPFRSGGAAVTAVQAATTTGTIISVAALAYQHAPTFGDFVDGAVSLWDAFDSGQAGPADAVVPVDARPMAPPTRTRPPADVTPYEPPPKRPKIKWDREPLDPADDYHVDPQPTTPMIVEGMCVIPAGSMAASRGFGLFGPLMD